MVLVHRISKMLKHANKWHWEVLNNQTIPFSSWIMVGSATEQIVTFFLGFHHPNDRRQCSTSLTLKTSPWSPCGGHGGGRREPLAKTASLYKLRILYFLHTLRNDKHWPNALINLPTAFNREDYCQRWNLFELQRSFWYFQTFFKAGNSPNTENS